LFYNAVAPGPQGKLYGLTSKGIFTIDESTHSVNLLATYPDGISGGFAIRGREIFFAQGPQLISYHYPVNRCNGSRLKLVELAFNAVLSSN